MSYKNLVVWQKSIKLVKHIYHITNAFPSEERFGLTSQMRRAAISIPSNIAEGYARKKPTENVQFINVAFASGCELETQIIIARELDFLSNAPQEMDDLLNQILRMLYTYRESLYAKGR